MSSVNSYRDSYPQVRPHMYWYPPNPEAFPPHMGFDPTKFPSVQGPWPYSTHAYPTPCNGSGNHMNFPGYFHSSPPPHPSFDHQQPCYYWGSHPGFFVPHPTCGGQTMPAPYYMMDHPVCDVGQLQHCCGCPNHVCNTKGGSSVKIEEHEPDLEQKAGYSSDGRNSLIPLNFKNYPYPMMWVPPNFTKIKEQSQDRPSRQDLGDSYEEVKPDEKFLLEKPKLNEWFPLQMRKKHPFMRPHDLTRELSDRRKDEGRKIQFPTIWVPSWDKQNEVGKEKNDPLSGSYKDALFSDGADVSKNAQVKSDPSKDANTHLAEQCLPGNKNMDGVADSNQENAARRVMSPQSVGRNQSLSPTKLSKLPPVCLRVDPLPKKKTSDEDSSSVGRNESERKDKISSIKQMEEETRNRRETSILPREANEKNVGKQYEKTVKVIEVTSGDSDETNDHKVGVTADFKKSSETENDRNTGQNTDGSLTERETKINSAGGLIVEDSTEEKIPRRTFSNSEAATLIQAVYRGYETRRWHTLQKLKQMAGVREGLIKIRHSVAELKSLNDSLCDANKFEKQRVVVGESIMTLLLQLDIIQGVHPSLRDVRKSLARELVGLQEEIDSLVCKSSNAPKEEHEEVRVENSVQQLNHTPVANSAEADDTVTSSIDRLPPLVQEEKHEELNELAHLRADTSPDGEHLHFGETGSGTPQNVHLRALDVKVKEGNDDLIGQQVTECVVEFTEATGKGSSEAADNLNQCDQLEDISIDVPSARIDAAPQPAVTVLLAEETNTPALGDPVDLGRDTCIDNDVKCEDSINTGENESEKMENGVTKNAYVARDSEVDFRNQSTLKAHDELVLVFSDAFKINEVEELSEELNLEEHNHLSEYAEADEVEGGNVPGVPEDRLHEEHREVKPSSQVEDGSNVPFLLVPEHGVPENHPHKDRETISSPQEEDDQVNLPPDNNNLSDTEEVGDDEEVRANVHPEHQPEGKAMLNQEKNWMKTSADDFCQAAATVKVEEHLKIIKSDLKEEQMLKEEVPNSLSTSGCEYQTRVEASEDDDVSVGLQEQQSVESNFNSVQPGAHVLSPGSNVGIPREVIGSSMMIMEENEKLRVMMEKLMEVGKEQINAIAKLSSRVRDLETKLGKSKKSRRRRCRGVTFPRMANAKSC